LNRRREEEKKEEKKSEKRAKVKYGVWNVLLHP
jgi:hypothetical protein